MVAGTTPVPCFEVTTRLEPSCISIRSTGAQSIPWQHSIGYQSCALAGDADAASNMAKTILRNMMCLVGSTIGPFHPPSRSVLLDIVIIISHRTTEDKPSVGANFPVIRARRLAQLRRKN
jgi:hypothetical protein